MEEGMQRSKDRILTTHAGSLPRSEDLAQMMFDRIDGKPVDAAKLDARVKEAVAEVVEKQLASGVDIVSDGEMSKPGFSNYACERFTGFEGSGRFVAADMAEVPGLAQRQYANEGSRHIRSPMAVGAVAVKDHESPKRDIANFKAALKGRDPELAFI